MGLPLSPTRFQWLPEQIQDLQKGSHEWQTLALFLLRVKGMDSGLEYKVSNRTEEVDGRCVSGWGNSSQKGLEAGKPNLGEAPLLVQNGLGANLKGRFWIPVHISRWGSRSLRTLFKSKILVVISQNDYFGYLSSLTVINSKTLKGRIRGFPFCEFLLCEKHSLWFLI